MRMLLVLGSAAAACLLLPAHPILAKEKVGQVTLVKTSLTGDGQPLGVQAPVHKDERIRTSASGLGEFVFRDGTKFAVGWNSSVVIDKFVFDDSSRAKDLTVKLTKGSFRWISGKSKSSAYKIVTPSGTVGIRGTALDVYVGPDGTTAVVLLSGAARFCGRNGCKSLQRSCDVVVATPRRGITDPAKVDRAVLDRLGTQRALPFLSGDQKLSGAFRRGGGSCGMSTRSLQKAQQQPERRDAPAQQRSAPSPEPPANGPPSNGPPSNGPPANGPPSSGPPSNGPPSSPPSTEPDGKGHGGVESGKGPENGNGARGNEPGKAGGSRD